MANIIAVLDVILKTTSSGKDPEKSVKTPEDVKSVKTVKTEKMEKVENLEASSDGLHHRIYALCRRIADGHKVDGDAKSLKSAESALPGLLMEVCASKQSLDMLSPSLLTVWINEMKISAPKSAAIGYLEVFHMSFVVFARCTLDETQWTVNPDKHRSVLPYRWTHRDVHLLTFCSQTMDAMHRLLVGTEQQLFGQRITVKIQRIFHDLMCGDNGGDGGDDVMKCGGEFLDIFSS